MKTNTKIKAFIILLTLFLFYTFLSAITYAETTSKDISEGIFRLHVIAASDSDEDQNLKYIVRDHILEYMNALTKNVDSKSDMILLVNDHISDFEQIAKDTILENGFNYDVNVSIGEFEFPTKYYGDISLPSGMYNALRIEIGKAEGKNWWCVLFPPLCFVDVSSGIVPEESKEIMKENLDEESFSVISENNSEVKFKFKLLELLQDAKTLMAKN